MAVPDFPSTQKGIVTQEDLALEVSSEVPLPELFDERMIIVKTRAVALNPTDFKMPATFPSIGAVNGCDFSGDVFRVGSLVTRWVVGDRVFGAVQGANPNNHQSGAFQQFVPTFEGEVLRVPEDMSYETAASIGGACIGTAAVALYCSLGLTPLPRLRADTLELGESAKIVLVYGGSTNTGAMAIQMIRLSGHKAIATCSPHNFDLVKGYGAAAVFDYHSPTCAADIKAYTKNNLRLVVDCITTPSSIKICYDAISRMGGRYTAVELPPEIPGLRKVVKQDWVMGMTLTGRPINLGKGYVRPTIPEHVEFGLIWAPLCQKLIEEKSIVPHPKRVSRGGWNEILAGLDELMGKKISGVKLVYTV